MSRLQLVWVLLLALTIAWGAETARSAPPVTTNLVFALDASDINGDGLANNPADGQIDTWVDMMAAVSLTTAGAIGGATTPTSPTLANTGVNGAACVTFDGAANMLGVQNGSAILNANTATLYIVARMAASGATDRGIITMQHAGETGGGTNGGMLTDHWNMWSGGANDSQLLFKKDNVDGPNIDIPGDTAWFLMEINSNGTNRIIYTNGVQRTSVANTDWEYNFENMVLGARINGTTFSPESLGNCQIAEVLFYDTSLSTANRLAVGGYLASKYGLDTTYDDVTVSNIAVDENPYTGSDSIEMTFDIICGAGITEVEVLNGATPIGSLTGTEVSLVSGDSVDGSYSFSLASPSGTYDLSVLATSSASTTGTLAYHRLLIPVPAAETLPVTNGLSFHLDASDLNGDGVANNPVDGQIDTWTDIIGGVNVTRVGAAGGPFTPTSPTLANAGVNGVACVTFDGNRDTTASMLGLSGTSLLNSDTGTIFMVSRMVASGSTDGGILAAQAPGQSGSGAQSFSLTDNWQSWDSGTFDTVMIKKSGDNWLTVPGGDTAWFILEVYGNGSQRVTYMDGAQADSDSYSGAHYNLNSLVLGARNEGETTMSPDNPGNCEIAEVIFYDNNLSAIERNDIGLALESKYGITTSYDDTPPGASITLDNSTPTNLDAVDISVDFDEEVTGFGISVLTLDGTLASSITAVTGGPQNYTVTVTPDDPDANGTVGITIGAGVTDLFTNPYAGGSSPLYTIDNNVPSVTISAPSTDTTTGAPVDYTLTYTFAATIAANNDIATSIVLNSTGSAIGVVTVTGSGLSSRTVTISGLSGAGTLGITLLGGTAESSTGLLDAGAGPSATFTVDTPFPAITNLNVTGNPYGPGDSVDLTFDVSAALPSSVAEIVVLDGVTPIGSLTGTEVSLVSGDANAGSYAFSISTPAGSYDLSILATADNANTATLAYYRPVVALPANEALPVTEGLALHLDASDINGDGSSNPSDGDIETWTDIINGYVLNPAQATVSGGVIATSPSLVNASAGINDQACVRFTNPNAGQNPASGEMIALQNGTSILYGSQATMFVVGHLVSSGPTSVNGGILCGQHGTEQTGAGQNSFELNDHWNTGNITQIVFKKDGSDRYINVPGGDLAWFIVEVKSNGTNRVVYMNGSQADSVADSGINYDFENLVLGARNEFSGYHPNWPSDSEIAEVIFFDKALSAADSNEVGGYLEAKYGLNTSYDLTPPTAVITLTDGNPTNLDAVHFGVNFSESVGTSFDASDVTVTGSLTGSAAVTGGPQNYVVTVTLDNPSSNGTVGIDIGTGVTDLLGNAYAGGSSALYTVDNAVPSVTIGAPSLTLTGGDPVEFTLTYTGVATIADNASIAATSITLNATGTAAGVVTVTGTGTTNRTVTISEISGNGTLSITMLPGTGYSASSIPDTGAGPSDAVTVYSPYVDSFFIISADFGPAAYVMTGAAVLGGGSDIWNALTTAPGTAATVFDTAGTTLTGVSISWDGAGSGISNNLNTLNDPVVPENLMRDYAHVHNGTIATTVTGLQAYTQFELIVYALGDNLNQGATITLDPANGGGSFVTLCDGSDTGHRDIYTNTNAYARFTGTVSVDGSISWTAGPDNVNPNDEDVESWQGVNGFQLYFPSAPVENPKEAGNTAVDTKYWDLY